MIGYIIGWWPLQEEETTTEPDSAATKTASEAEAVLAEEGEQKVIH